MPLTMKIEISSGSFFIIQKTISLFGCQIPTRPIPIKPECLHVDTDKVKRASQ